VQRLMARIKIGPVPFICDESLPALVMICSHERSGTHFVINSIAKNSGYRNDPLLNYDLDPLGSYLNFHSTRDVRIFFSHLADNHCASMIKNHFAAGFFIEPPNIFILRQLCKIIYIARDPLEVMFSYRRFVEFMPWREGPTGLSVSAFANAPPEGRMLRYQFGAINSIIDRWIAHVLGWLKLAQSEDNILFVRYRDLDRRHSDTMNKILNFLDVPCPPAISRPDRVAQSVYVPAEATIDEAERARLAELIAVKLRNSDELHGLFPDFLESDAGAVGG
jgi:hypothetical protein